jgi:hypothetical protein
MRTPISTLLSKTFADILYTHFFKGDTFPIGGMKEENSRLTALIYPESLVTSGNPRVKITRNTGMCGGNSLSIGVLGLSLH